LGGREGERKGRNMGREGGEGGTWGGRGGTWRGKKGVWGEEKEEGEKITHLVPHLCPKNVNGCTNIEEVYLSASALNPVSEMLGSGCKLQMIE
jgi:hypothetical protein